MNLCPQSAHGIHIIWARAHIHEVPIYGHEMGIMWACSFIYGHYVWAQNMGIIWAVIMGTMYGQLTKNKCPYSAHIYGHNVFNVWAL